MNDQGSTTGKRFASVSNMPAIYSDLGWEIGTFRWLIFNRDTNDFKVCLLKVGSRWVIDMDKFETWLQSNSTPPPTNSNRKWNRI